MKPHVSSKPYYGRMGEKSFSYDREATNVHKLNSSFCCMSHLMLVVSLGLDLGATRKNCLNALESDVSCYLAYGEAKNVNIF